MTAETENAGMLRHLPWEAPSSDTAFWNADLNSQDGSLSDADARRATLGDRHPDLLVSKNNLATLWKDQGKLIRVGQQERSREYTGVKQRRSRGEAREKQRRSGEETVHQTSPSA